MEAIAPTMRLVIVSAVSVSDTPKNYNSNFHTSNEAPDLSVPSEKPYSFARWIYLIARSRNLPQELVQIITLTRSQAKLLLQASNSSVQKRTLSLCFMEDFEDDGIFPALRTLKYPASGLFVRLNECSPKTGALGIQALRTPAEIVLQLTSSDRTASAMKRSLETDRNGLELFFLPFNPKMDTEKEYRVFCAPISGKITAVSQYKWHQPSVFKDKSKDELQQTFQAIFNEIREVHAEIMLEVQSGKGGEMDKLMLEQGFTFDVMYDVKNNRCELIELNIFGARSGCGSCLFHWLRDRDMLYGKEPYLHRERDEVIIKISI